MNAPADCIALLKRLLEPPSAEFAEFASTGNAPAMPLSVGEQIALFVERTSELTFDERQELFEETFCRRATLRADWQRVMKRLEEGLATADPAEAVDNEVLLQRLRTALLRDRNPYHHLIAAAQVLSGS